MRKLLSTLSSTLQGGGRGGLLLLLLVASVSAIYASDTKVDGIWYDFDSSTKTASVTYRGSSYSSYEGEYSGSVTIPETVTYNGTTYSVTSIGDRAFGRCTSLTSITLPNSVTSIEEFAFSGCYALTSITIPNSITSIGDNAFDDCSSLPVENNLRYADTYLVEAVDKTLSTYSIKEGTKWIGDYAFEYCTSLTSITIPNSVTSIGWSAFIRCSALTSVTIGNNVAIIDWYAFYNCSSLTSITIPNSVTSIKNQAFQGCSSLTSVTIGNNVTLIDNLAFFECSSLDTLRILATTPPTLRDEVFSRTPSPICYIPCGTKSAYEASDWASQVSEFVEEGCEEPIDPTWQITYTSTNGKIVHPKYDTGYSTNGFGANLLSNTYENGVGKMIFDAPVTSIGGAYFHRSNLTSIVIPSTVKTIERNAFYESYDLTSVSLAEGLVNIDEHAFSFCRSLTTITIPNSVTYLGENVFGQCYGLSSISIGSGITNINERVFQNCSALTSITIPNCVTSIGSWAFDNCSALTSVTIPNSVTSIGYAAFSNCSALESIIVEEGNAIYDSRENCNAIIETKTNTLLVGCQNTTIPNSVTSIGSWAFRDCSSLPSITIPNSITSIGGYAFYNCPSLTSITCEATTPPVLELYVFPSELTTAYIPCGTKEAYEASDWAQYVSEFVEDCYSNQKCGDNLFWKYNDTQLSITGHGDMYDYDIEPQPWMQYRSKMQTISLPDGMTSIGASAFANCKYVKSIAIPAAVEKISDSAFEDCRMLSTITFAGSSVLTHIGNWAFYNNHELTSITIPEGVIEIGYAAFYGCTYLDELTLPASMEYIADNGFALCAKLRRINVNASTPPVVEARTFEDVDRSIPVYVPNTSIELYKAAPVWQEFNIVGKNNTTTDVDNIHSPITNYHKLIRNGQLLILREGKTYNVMGQEL